jgi:hypothetical protein
MYKKCTYYTQLLSYYVLCKEKLRYLLLLLFFRFVAQKTNNLIQNMFTEPVPVDSKLVVSSALYFNGE